MDINLKGVYNFRDMGGVKGHSGKIVKRGMLFRSDELSMLTDEDLEVLKNIPVVTNVDFRDEREKLRAPNRFPKSLQRNVELPVRVGRLLDEHADEGVLDGVTCMKYINRLFVLDFQNEYRKFFDILMNDNNAVIFHCSAGKDRTGFAAALIYSALGVRKPHIYEDYMLSKALIEPKYKNVVSPEDKVYPMYTVEREYLEEAFKTMDEEYGGVDSYLKNQLKVDVDYFKKKYLE